MTWPHLSPGMEAVAGPTCEDWCFDGEFAVFDLKLWFVIAAVILFIIVAGDY